MNNSNNTNETPINAELNTAVLPTNEQYKYAATEAWKKIRLLEMPVVVILPVKEKLNWQSLDNPLSVFAYQQMGRICSAGRYDVVELLALPEGSDLSYLLIEFEGNKAAQAFAKRLRRGKSQLLIAGEDCIRFVEIRPNPDRDKVSELILTDPDHFELIDSYRRNIVSHIGQDMTNGEVEYFELLPSQSHAALADKLQQDYRRAVRAARHMPIINRPVAQLQPAQAEVAPQN